MANRVVIAHNSYQQTGGEDAVVANEHALLQCNGWEPYLWSVSNDAIAGPWSTLKAAIAAPYARASRETLAGIIATHRPAVVHVHNFFPLLSPAIYDSCRAAGVAVVQSLHNYRIICPGTLLMRNGRPCEACIGGSPYRAAVHGCYRASRAASLPVARMVSVHRRRGTWTRSVDRFIALSEFSKSRFVAAGIPGDLIAVKPNFVYDRAARGGSDRSGALYVGRLSVEKGIATLLRAWRGSAVPLRIVGDGPLRPMITAANLATVEALGAKTPGEVADEMGRAAFLVLPSECYENFPLAVAEAFRQSLPVIGSRIGAVAEIVEDGKTGLHFLPGDSAALAASVRWAASHPEEMAAMGARARRVYEEKYTPDRNFRQLARIYEDAIARAGSQRA